MIDQVLLTNNNSLTVEEYFLLDGFTNRKNRLICDLENPPVSVAKQMNPQSVTVC